MTSLPIPMPPFPVPAQPSSSRENENGNETETEQSLRLAFRTFAEAAGSLDRSYAMLRSEVARLHEELAASRAGLARSEEENREMRQQLDRILDGLPCGVLVESSEGTVARVNPEGRRLLHLVAGAESKGAVPPNLRVWLDRARAESRESEACFRNESGEECWLQARYAAVPPGERATPGEPVAIFILRDVSEARRWERERERSRREQALAEMSAVLAHEIRNPLGSLELFASLLAGAEIPAECRPWVEQVQGGIRTLGATVNNVLHFHSLPAPQRLPVEMGGLLDWAGGFLLPMARQSGVELRLRNQLRGARFPADRYRLEQVLMNLLLNALRVMPGRGWVEIAGWTTRRQDGDAIVICVSDSGPGIDPGQVGKLFEAGFSTRAGGAGLGLAVSRKIVEQHGGTLVASNRMESVAEENAGKIALAAQTRGACFTLTLPLESEISPEDGPMKSWLLGMTRMEELRNAMRGEAAQ